MPVYCQAFNGTLEQNEANINVIVTLMSLVTPTASPITCQNVGCDIGSFLVYLIQFHNQSKCYNVN